MKLKQGIFFHKDNILVLYMWFMATHPLLILENPENHPENPENSEYPVNPEYAENPERPKNTEYPEYPENLEYPENSENHPENPKSYPGIQTIVYFLEFSEFF